MLWSGSAGPRACVQHGGCPSPAGIPLSVPGHARGSAVLSLALWSTLAGLGLGLAAAAVTARPKGCSQCLQGWESRAAGPWEAATFLGVQLCPWQLPVPPSPCLVCSDRGVLHLFLPALPEASCSLAAALDLQARRRVLLQDLELDFHLADEHDGGENLRPLPGVYAVLRFCTRHLGTGVPNVCHSKVSGTGTPLEAIRWGRSVGHARLMGPQLVCLAPALALNLLWVLGCPPVPPAPQGHTGSDAASACGTCPPQSGSASWPGSPLCT